MIRFGARIFAAVLLLLGMAIPATAAVDVGDNLKLYGDVRFRYEVDNDDKNRTDPKEEDTRDRARIRLRIGLTYAVSDTVELGARLSTNSRSTQSPHQTLGQTDETKQGRNADFGVDKAYLKLKFGPDNNGFVWGGKNSIALWQQNEQYWTTDFNPEGVAAGYNLSLGAASLTVQGGYYLLQENNFFGTFSDDSFTIGQVVAMGDVGPAHLTLAGATGTIADDNENAVDFGDGGGNYSLGSVQVKVKDLVPIPIRVGFDFLIGDPDTEVAGADDTGFVIQAKTKIAGFSLAIYHYDVPVNAVPAQGLLTQDNFRFSSNFTGQRYQVGYKFNNGIAVDFRIYDQEVDEAAVCTGVAAPGGCGSYIEDVDNTRYQLNFNVKF